MLANVVPLQGSRRFRAECRATEQEGSANDPESAVSTGNERIVFTHMLQKSHEPCKKYPHVSRYRPPNPIFTGNSSLSTQFPRGKKRVKITRKPNSPLSPRFFRFPHQFICTGPDRKPERQ
jgi:hypothetical protein